jgi:hypothetical protein
MPENRSPTHRTTSGDRRLALQKEAREPARNARALRKAACAPARPAGRLQAEAEKALAEGQALKLPGPARGPDSVAEGVGQANPQGLQDLQLLDGFLVRGRQDA